MKHFVIIIFAICAIALAFIFFSQRKTQDSIPVTADNTRTVIPQNLGSQTPEAGGTAGTEAENTTVVSFVPLYSNEILLSTLSLDFDGDGYDDQIVSIRKVDDPHIRLIIGLYDPFSRQYKRSTTITTEIIQTRTFSFTAMDLIGNHKQSLIYTGYDEDGNSVMKIYLPEKNNNTLSLHLIGDFKSDGLIFIQQLDRFDTYESQGALGVSFPVWVYSSAVSQNGTSTDQVQTKYVWDSAQYKYRKDTETHVTEKNVMQAELNKILDGTEETLEQHLSGLWYKTDAPKDSIRGIFFAPQSQEVIFQGTESQEVYTWLSSTVRHNGMYITAINSLINSITRRIDVSLISTDEIKITIRDDIGMTINESALVDGYYKKQKHDMSLFQSSEETPDLLQILENQNTWLINGLTKIFFDDQTYKSENASGRIALSQCNGTSVLQFKGTPGAPFYNQENYTAHIEYDESDTITAVTLQPVSVTPLGTEPFPGATIRLEPYKAEDTESAPEDGQSQEVQEAQD